MALRFLDRLIARPGLLWGLMALVSVGLWFTIFPADASVTSDDGAYAIAAQALADGEWSVPHVLSDQDPNGLSYPYQNSSITEEGYFPGVRHAAWVVALKGLWELGGPLGLHVLPAAGFALAVGSAAALSTAVGRREIASMAAVLALASPLLFNALQLWAHAFAAASVAVAMLGALVVMQTRPSRTGVPLFLIGVAVSAALRADALIFAVAISGIVVASGLRSHRFRTVLIGLVGGVLALVTYGAVAVYATSITGSAAAVGAAESRAGATAESWIGGRVRGVIHTFFSMNDSAGPFVLLVLALAASVLGLMRLCREDTERATVFFAAAAAVWLLRAMVFPREMASGLMGAWPVVMFAAVRSWVALTAGERRIVGMLGLAAFGIAVTQYDDGGGLNWGGRFIAPAIPALAVLAAAGLRSALETVSSLRPPTIAIAALVLAPVTASLIVDGTIRTHHDEIVERLPDTSRAPVITASVPLPRLAWRTFPDLNWLRIPRTEDGAERLSRWLRAEEIDEVVLFGVSVTDAETLVGGEVQFSETERPRLVKLEP